MDGRSARVSWAAASAVAVTAGVAGGYLGLVTGAVPIDLGVGRRVRPLGPQVIDMAAPRELVFDVIAQPYLGSPAHSTLVDSGSADGVRGSAANRASILTGGNDRICR